MKKKIESGLLWFTLWLVGAVPIFVVSCLLRLGGRVLLVSFGSAQMLPLEIAGLIAFSLGASLLLCFLYGSYLGWRECLKYERDALQ